jgi:hypothetical protein
LDLLDDDRLLDLRPRARRTDAAAVIGEERARAAPTPEANAALREWAGPAPAAQAPPEPQGPCAVCSAKPARLRCPACGLGVCSADVWTMLGLCRPCAAERIA